jgi:hypothetical protein
MNCHLVAHCTRLDDNYHLHSRSQDLKACVP